MKSCLPLGTIAIGPDSKNAIGVKLNLPVITGQAYKLKSTTVILDVGSRGVPCCDEESESWYERRPSFGVFVEPLFGPECKVSGDICKAQLVSSVLLGDMGITVKTFPCACDYFDASVWSSVGFALYLPQVWSDEIAGQPIGSVIFEIDQVKVTPAMERELLLQVLQPCSA